MRRLPRCCTIPWFHVVAPSCSAEHDALVVKDAYVAKTTYEHPAPIGTSYVIAHAYMTWYPWAPCRTVGVMARVVVL